MSGENSQTYANWPDHYGNPDWFLHDRFGMFIHFGIYSPAARHEWVMTYEQIHPDRYKKYFDHFNPDLFDATKWVKAAKKAGMKYIVVTTKHHDGFALWDTQLSDYKATNTQIKRDLIKEVVEACQEEGLKVGFYHSLIDWYHPEFVIDGLHPQRNDKTLREQNHERDMDKYTDFLHGQVRELLTNYGKVDYLWFDYSYPDQGWDWSQGKGKSDWKSEKLEEMVIDLQPDILLNDRADLNRGVITPEQHQPREPLTRDGLPVIWEACQTMNGSWGYHRDNLDWKSSEMILKMLIDTVSKDGNLLMNIGPNGRGEFDFRSLDRLEDIGEWMQVHSRSIYGAGHSNHQTPIDCRYTQNGKSLYLHIYSWPFKHIHLDGLSGKVDYIQFLHDASEIQYQEFKPNASQTHMDTSIKEGAIVLDLPVQKPNQIIPVIEIILK